MSFKLLIEEGVDVKNPVRGHSTDAGVDFFIPNGHKEIVLGFGDDVVIDTKIKCILPSRMALIAFNKSGRATKNGLTVGACVIDEGYQGNLHIHIVKSIRKRISFFEKCKNYLKYGIFGDVCILKGGDKVSQFILVKTEYKKPEINYGSKITIEEFFNGVQTSRGNGKFASTGMK